MHTAQIPRSFLQLATAAALAVTATTALAAEWKPTRPIEFVVTAGPGGGTDQFARVVQSVLQKQKLVSVPIIVSNKGGGAGTEAMIYAKASKGDPHKLVFSTNLAYLMPMITKVGYSAEDITPVAIMAADEFLLWSNSKASYENAQQMIDAARSRGSAFRMGGAQSKDTDHILTRQIERATGVTMTYVPFKSGGEVAVQLAGGHIDANTNNPSENLSHWRAGTIKPLCVFSKARLPFKEPVAGNASYADVPTCKESGIAVDEFHMPRTVWAPAGISPEQVAYFEGLMAKVREQPEFREWLRRGTQSELFLQRSQLRSYIANDMAKHRVQFQNDGWLLKE